MNQLSDHRADRLLIAVGVLVVASLASAAEPQPLVIPAGEKAPANAQSVALSPDGAPLAAGFGGPSNGRFPLTAGGDGGLVLWETATGKRRWLLPDYGDILQIGFSADGKRLFYGRIYTPGDSVDDDLVRAVDVATGKIEKTWQRESFALSADGKWLALGGRETAVLDVQTLAEKLLIPGLHASVLALSKDGNSLAAIQRLNTRALCLVDVPTGKIASADRSIDSSCQAIAFSPHGDLVATGHAEGQIRLWRTADLSEMKILDTKSPGQARPLFTPGGQTLLALSQPAGGVRWSYDRKEPGGFKFDPQKAGPACQLAHYSLPDCTLAALWQFENGSFRTHYARSGSRSAPEQNPARLALSADGKRLAIGASGVLLLDFPSGNVVRQFVHAGS